MWPVPLTLTTTKTAERAASKDFSGVFRAWTKVWAHCRWLPPADRLTGFSPSTCLCLHLKKVMVYFSKDILSSLFTARQKENNTRFQQLTEAVDPSILAARSLIGKLSPFYTTKKEKWKKQKQNSTWQKVSEGLMWNRLQTENGLGLQYLFLPSVVTAQFFRHNIIHRTEQTRILLSVSANVLTLYSTVLCAVFSVCMDDVKNTKMKIL